MEQLSFIDTKAKKPKKVKVILKVPQITASVGLKVKITTLTRDNIGIITKFNITKKWAFVSYSYLDDPLQEIKYGYFNVENELRVLG